MSQPKRSNEITIIEDQPLAETDDEPEYTKEEAAEALNVCMTIFQQRFQPHLSVRRRGKRLMFRVAEVLALRDRADIHRRAVDAPPLATAKRASWAAMPRERGGDAGAAA